MLEQASADEAEPEDSRGVVSETIWDRRELEQALAEERMLHRGGHGAWLNGSRAIAMPKPPKRKPKAGG